MEPPLTQETETPNLRALPLERSLQLPRKRTKGPLGFSPPTIASSDGHDLRLPSVCRGNAAFTSGDAAGAALAYTEALRLVAPTHGALPEALSSPPDGSAAEPCPTLSAPSTEVAPKSASAVADGTQRAILLANRAQAYLRLKRWDDAAADCLEVRAAH